MNEDKIVIIDENGKEVEMEVLFTFQSDETEKQYVLYFNPEDDQEGNVFVSSYTEDGDLTPVEDEAEWEMIQEVFNTFIEEEHGHHHHDHDHEHGDGCCCCCGHDHEH